MPKKKSSNLPKDVIARWPEIFEDIKVESIPVEYLHSVRVIFNDGRTWDIDVEKSKRNHQSKDLQTILEQMFEEYDSHIANVDFRLDTDRIKRDIQKRTHIFLKKNK